ncbi:MAG: 6-bladed beta-propeller [Chromatiales bacterium]|nr:6-bladed beta-propeller [Chromatiales bacterium]
MRLPILIVIVALQACATGPRTFRIAGLPPANATTEVAVWPKGDNVPRFVYVGQLTGEDNFEGDASMSGGEFFAWLVGLGQEQREPMLLRRPQGVAEDQAGRVWVADVGRQAVFLFDPAAGELRVHTQAGGGVSFVSPVGLVPLANGEILVADADLAQVVRLSSEGTPLNRFGEGVLLRPTGIAVDETGGRIYVADTRANAIQVFDNVGNPLYRFGGQGAGLAQLNAPTYLTISDGQVFVTDTLNARVEVFDLDGHFLRSFGERGLYIGNLTRPKGIAASDDGLIYLVESYYDYLLVFDPQGHFLLPIGGSGSGPGEFSLPSGVWAGRGGRVYLSDMLNARVAVFQFLGGTP